jgi:hypothetical protein
LRRVFLVGSCFQRPEVGTEQIPFPRYSPRVYTLLAKWKVARRSLRIAELPRQPLRVARRVLAGVAFTDIGGRPAIARRAIRREGYKSSVLLVVWGATGDHLVGQAGGVDGVYQSSRIGFSRLSDERHLVRLGVTEV